MINLFYNFINYYFCIWSKLKKQWLKSKGGKRGLFLPPKLFSYRVFGFSCFAGKFWWFELFQEIQKIKYCSIDNPHNLDTNFIHSLQTYKPCQTTAATLLLTFFPLNLIGCIRMCNGVSNDVIVFLTAPTMNHEQKVPG